MDMVTDSIKKIANSSSPMLPQKLVKILSQKVKLAYVFEEVNRTLICQYKYYEQNQY